MAFDSSLLFYNGTTLTTATAAIVTVAKTPASGIGIELAVTSASSQGTLDVVVKSSDSSTTGFVTVASFPQVTSAGGVNYLVVQSNKKYLELVPTTGGTNPSFVVTAGIVSGPQKSDGVIA
jgi:hypothetical protein